MREFDHLKRNILVRYILSYTVVLSVAILLLAIFGAKLLSNKQRDAIERSENGMTQYINLIEDRFAEVSNLARMISVDEDMYALLRKEQVGYFDCYQLSNRLHNYAQSNIFIDQIYIMLEAEDVVVGSNGVITDMDKFYRIRYNGNLRQLGAWEKTCWEEYRGETVSDIVWNGTDMEPTVVYSWPAVVSDGRYPKRWRIMIYINPSELENLVPVGGELADFSIHQRDGELIWKQQDERAQDTTEQLAVTQLSTSGRQYRGLFWDDNILEEWNALFRLLMLMILGFCVLGGGVCIFLAWRSSRPIVDIAQMLDQNTAGKASFDRDIYDYMRNSLAGIVADRNALTEEVQRRIPILQATFINRLLRGTLDETEMLERRMAELQIPLVGTRYCVAIFSMESLGLAQREEQSPTVLKLLLDQVLALFMERNTYLCSESDAEWEATVIFALQGETTLKDVEYLCEQIAEIVYREYHISLRCGMGQDHSELTDIALSFSQAEKALDMGVPTDRFHVFRYAAERENRSGYYYPMELEQRLMRAAVNGNVRQVEEVFRELEKENMKSRHLSREMSHLFLRELEGTYCKMISEIPRSLPEQNGDSPQKLQAARDLGDFRQRFLWFAQNVQSANDSKRASFQENIKKYVDDNFTNADLSLTVLADRFRVTEVYMSRQFKENVGITFSQYLEGKRMDYAGELLRAGNSVNAAAAAAGYQSAHTFRRAYKRYYGNLPSEERRLQ